MCEALVGVAATALVPARGPPLGYYNHGLMGAEHVLLEELLCSTRLILLHYTEDCQAFHGRGVPLIDCRFAVTIWPGSKTPTGRPRST